MVDDLQKLREVKIGRLVKDLKQTDSTIDVSQFTESELNINRKIIGGALQKLKKIQSVVGIAGVNQQ